MNKDPKKKKGEEKKRSCEIRLYMKMVKMQSEEIYLPKAEKGSVCGYMLEEWLWKESLCICFVAKRSWRREGRARKG